MLDKSAQQQIIGTIQKAIEDKDIAGASMMIFKNGQEVFYHEDGHANVEEDKEIKRNTIYRLYSMSKPVTATAVMILVERGMIDLYDPISKYLDGFKNQMVVEDGEIVPVKRSMTIKDLMNMTSGLLYPGGNVSGHGVAEVFEEIDERLLGENPMDTVTIANELGKVPLAFHPGDSFAYGTSADILGAMIEVVSGKKFGDFMQDEIFTPLKMEDTAFFVEENKRHRLATTYETTARKELIVYNGNNLGIINKMDREPAFQSGGAGLASTIDDYAKFALMLLNNGTYEKQQILRPKTVEYLTTQVLTDEQMQAFKYWDTLKGHSYGNLMRVVNRPDLAGTIVCDGEYGWDGWLGCYFANCPKEKLTMLLMMQKKDAGTTTLTRKLRNIVLSTLG